MNILLRIITTLLLLSPLHSHAEDPYTVAKFQIDVANEMQQLSWISQMAYRLSDYQKKLNSGEVQASNEVFCDAPPMDINTFIEYLNKNHADELISADQAIETVFMELGEAWPCSE